LDQLWIEKSNTTTEILKEIFDESTDHKEALGTLEKADAFFKAKNLS
jgi:hypothetical protein